MCFLLIVVNEFLGNLYVSRKILYFICNIFDLSKNTNIQKIYKNFEVNIVNFKILYGNEESFRDYLIGRNTKK